MKAEAYEPSQWACQTSASFPPLATPHAQSVLTTSLPHMVDYDIGT